MRGVEVVVKQGDQGVEFFVVTLSLYKGAVVFIVCALGEQERGVL